MFLKLYKSYKAKKYFNNLYKKCNYGKQFCESLIYSNRIEHIYNNLKIQNNFGKNKVNFGNYNNLSLSLYLKEAGTVSTGNYVFMNSKCNFYISNNLKIGNYCLFGPNVTIWDSDNHSINPRLRQQDAIALSKNKLNAFSIGGGDIIIEDNVWIGMDVLILGGVTIGKNSVIAARSVVTKDVKENSVVAGIPASFIKSVIDE